MRFLLLLLVLGLPLAACDSTDDTNTPDAAVLGGTYASTVSGGGGITVESTIEIPETTSGDFVITGGTLVIEAGTDRDSTTLSGTGTFTPPSSVRLEPTPADDSFAFAPVDGTLSSDGSRITATQNGQTVTFVRQ